MGVYQINLKKFFTLKTIAQRIENNMNIYPSKVRELVFKKSKQHQFPVIGIDEISKVIKNVPVVRRGTPAVTMKHGSRKIEYIEPQGVDVVDFVSAADLNNLRLLEENNVQGVINGRIDNMLEVVQKTIGALCAQSLTGAIEYPMIAEGVNEVYSVSFGDTCELLAGDIVKLTDSSTVKDVYKILDDMASILEDNNWGGDVLIFAGKDAYQMILGILENKSSKQNIIATKIDKSQIEVGGFVITRNKSSYHDRTGLKREIPDKALCMVDKAAPHTLFFTALDDLDAGLIASPFWASPGETKKNPSGIEIIGKSKPLPAPVVKAICWANEVV